MPGPRVVPVQGDEKLPQRADVVVIGGGIIGTSTALELAERGLSVALCEKGGIGQEQSSRNWGWVRISRRDPRELSLMAAALEIWQGLSQRVGKDVGYKRAGILFTCADDKSYDEHARWQRNLEGYPVQARMVSGSELNRLLPDNRAVYQGALYTPADGRAEPQKAAPAIAEAARAQGAAILTDCAVRGLEQSAGRISGVVTERGPIACSSVVLAGGAWSSLFCSPLGLHLPQLKVMNSVLRTEPLAGGPESAIWTQTFAVRKRQDGGYTVASGHENIADIVPDSFRYARQFMPALKQQYDSLSFRLGRRFIEEAALPRQWPLQEASPFEYCRVLDPMPSIEQSNRAFRHLVEAFPVFRNARIAQRWAGCIDVTPDAVPVISSVDTLPGFFIATGFSGHGFGIGPAAGRLMANLVTGEKPIVDTHDFRLSRFSDGSNPRPISGF
ncbi:glycine/D-amino acid oxidase-like deaminating enzyme [Pseudomonas duriflava]|uniref:Glycine/D-amino acid oxidase-like deaminating enzyme n=1 Tax=Pseudomonas duriflava TaxID=459528 RepID=A0A562QC06_9PSED|nr:FAD-binding oxidoreductase [Pseudomonas duriflava]TWI53710.1 glycine/D-amino acid oxidase-like deaminating enzyme [Pseudomonas duriflava]